MLTSKPDPVTFGSAEEPRAKQGCIEENTVERSRS
jgi:hypothetical protein